MSEKAIVVSSFVADQDLEPRKAKLLLGLNFFWLGVCLLGLIATTIEAVQ